jgi:ribosomal protein S18 acetylase RimI-like enzyme
VGATEGDRPREDRQGTSPPPSGNGWGSSGSAPAVLVDLEGNERDRALPAIRDGFTGIYRWHAKRMLGEVPIVRAAMLHEEVVGVTLLDLLVPEVGYVYYVSVRSAFRGRGIGKHLLDDALRIFVDRKVEVVYAAVQADNAPSARLFTQRGFREVARKETTWREGGLGAWGLRSRMRLVPGELLLGRRLRDAPRDGERVASAPG